MKINQTFHFATASLAFCTVLAAAPSWQYEQPWPATGGGFGAATGPDGRIYVTGGLIGMPQNSISAVYRYDPINQVWTTVAPLNAARAYHATVTGCDGKIY